MEGQQQMVLDRIGIRVPSDRGELIEGSYSYDDDTGIEREEYKSTGPDMGIIVGIWHVDMGLVTWYRAWPHHKN